MREGPEPIEGTVSAVEPIRKQRGRVAIFVDGAFVMELGAELAIERGVKKGTNLPQQRAVDLWSEDQQRSALARALHFLSYRGRTVDEVRTKLSAVGFGSGAADHAIGELVRLGYLDDVAFAERFARSRLTHKSHGPRRIHADLRRLGVPVAIVDDQIKDVATPGEIQEAAERAGSKYWRRVSAEPDPKRQRWRFVQYLVRRGFDFDVASAAFEAVAAEHQSE